MCVLGDNETWSDLDGCTVRMWLDGDAMDKLIDGMSSYEANDICDEVQPDHFFDLMEPGDLRQLADMLDKLYAEEASDEANQ